MVVGSYLIEVVKVALSEVLHLVDAVVLLAAVLSGNGDSALASLVFLAPGIIFAFSILCGLLMNIEDAAVFLSRSF